MNNFKLLATLTMALVILLFAFELSQLTLAFVVRRDVILAGVEDGDDDYTKLNKIAAFLTNNTDRENSGLVRCVATASDDMAALACLMTREGNCRETAAAIIAMARDAGVDTRKLSIVYANNDYTRLAGQYNSVHAAIEFDGHVIDLCLADVNHMAWYEDTDAWLAECFKAVNLVE